MNWFFRLLLLTALFHSSVATFEPSSESTNEEYDAYAIAALLNALDLDSDMVSNIASDETLKQVADAYEQEQQMQFEEMVANSVENASSSLHHSSDSDNAPVDVEADSNTEQQGSIVRGENDGEGEEEVKIGHVHQTKEEENRAEHVDEAEHEEEEEEDDISGENGSPVDAVVDSDQGEVEEEGAGKEVDESVNEIEKEVNKSQHALTQIPPDLQNRSSHVLKADSVIDDYDGREFRDQGENLENNNLERDLGTTQKQKPKDEEQDEEVDREDSIKGDDGDNDDDTNDENQAVDEDANARISESGVAEKQEKAEKEAETIGDSERQTIREVGTAQKLKQKQKQKQKDEEQDEKVDQEDSIQGDYGGNDDDTNNENQAIGEDANARISESGVAEKQEKGEKEVEARGDSEEQTIPARDNDENSPSRTQDIESVEQIIQGDEEQYQQENEFFYNEGGEEKSRNDVVDVDDTYEGDDKYGDAEPTGKQGHKHKLRGNHQALVESPRIARTKSHDDNSDTDVGDLRALAAGGRQDDIPAASALPLSPSSLADRQSPSSNHNSKSEIQLFEEQVEEETLGFAVIAVWIVAFLVSLYMFRQSIKFFKSQTFKHWLGQVGKLRESSSNGEGLMLGLIDTHDNNRNDDDDVEAGVSMMRKRAGGTDSKDDYFEAVELQPLTFSRRFPELHNVTSTPLLTHDMIENIINVLPRLMNGKDMIRLYSSARDGFNIGTFYELTEQAGPTLLVIKDMDHHVFGAYIPCSWRKSDIYYGTGETFTFTLWPEFEKFDSTGKNTYFVLGNDSFIAVGGGNNFAIWLDSTFRKGSSLQCDTFDNPELAGRGDFECIEMEVWGFQAAEYRTKYKP